MHSGTESSNDLTLLMLLLAKCTVTQFSMQMQMAYYVLIRLGWLISKTKTLKFLLHLKF